MLFCERIENINISLGQKYQLGSYMITQTLGTDGFDFDEEQWAYFGYVLVYAVYVV